MSPAAKSRTPSSESTDVSKLKEVSNASSKISLMTDEVVIHFKTKAGSVGALAARLKALGFQTIREFPEKDRLVLSAPSNELSDKLHITPLAGSIPADGGQADDQGAGLPAGIGELVESWTTPPRVDRLPIE